MSEARTSVTVKTEVICVGKDGKVKWQDGTSTNKTLEELGVKSIEEAELIYKGQVIHVGGETPR